MENETIDQCLERIQQAGYIPVKRIEKPIFKEVIKKGEKGFIPDNQQVIFEAILSKDEQ
ncbi:NETI motif-containing protein [Amphibacillus sp. Q70]|uniref:NETI motif-containing protein n=1 Tax=Amphibacillus sp. Q70 TaxID=3453416 RepID=UPI003F83AA29